MDKIKILLEKLDNKVTAPIGKRLDGLKNLHQRLDLAKSELRANPDDEELKESLEEITDYVNDYEDDLIEDLEDLLEEKTKSIQKPKGEEKPNSVETPIIEEKEKSSGGITALIIGSVLLVASIGAINIFKNNR
jgi:hypothetical protein